MALLNSVAELLNRKPGDVVKEQMKKLYLRLYPYIIDDFAHKEDLNIAMSAVAQELLQIKGLLQGHVHATTTPGAPTSPTAIFVPPVRPDVIPTEVFARALVLPGGIPQPTGEGISIQPSRVDPNPIAIPPLNPLDPSV